jgi:hypothetical protein
MGFTVGVGEISIGMGLGLPQVCEAGQSVGWRQITREGEVHPAAWTQAVPAKPADDSSEQHRVPGAQSSGPSQVTTTEQTELHTPTRLIISVAGQQGPVALVHVRPSQDTVAFGAIAGGASFVSVVAESASRVPASGLQSQSTSSV